MRTKRKRIRVGDVVHVYNVDGHKDVQLIGTLTEVIDSGLRYRCCVKRVLKDAMDYGYYVNEVAGFAQEELRLAAWGTSRLGRAFMKGA
jgi:glycosyltransferase A (GT-A) superfamily protein (DUF2064 family)